MREHAGCQPADGVGQDGLAGNVGKAQGVHHGHMGAQVAAKAHAHAGKHRHIMRVGQAFCDQAGHDGQGRAG